MPREFVTVPTAPAGAVAGQIRIRCPVCGEMVPSADLVGRGMVCAWCDFHFPLEAGPRLERLVDEGSFRPLEGVPPVPGLFGQASLLGRPLALAVGDPATRWSGAECQALVALAGEARMGHLPLVWVVAAPHGTEAGPLWPGIQAALGQLGEAGLPWISLLTGPCFGAVAAAAVQADLVCAEPGAVVAPVLPEALRQSGHLRVQGVRSPRDLLRAGWADAVLPRSDQRSSLADLLDLLGVAGKGRQRSGSEPAIEKRSGRWTPLDALALLFAPFFELHGDRGAEDDPALVGGLARLRQSGSRLLVLVTAGRRSRLGFLRRGSEAIGAGGWRKGTRLLGLARRFGLPVVTLVGDTGLRVKRRGRPPELAAALGEFLSTLLSLPVPTVAVRLEGGGGEAGLALSAADRVLALAGAADELERAGIVPEATCTGGEDLAAALAEHLDELTQTYAVHGALGRRKLLQRRHVRWTRRSLGEDELHPGQRGSQG